MRLPQHTLRTELQVSIYMIIIVIYTRACNNVRTSAFFSCIFSKHAVAGIIRQPESREVTLNHNATFYCSATKPVQWIIIGEKNITDTITANKLSDSLNLRGFTSKFTHISYFDATLKVLGSLQNNKTLLFCQQSNRQSKSEKVTLTVLGKNKQRILSIIILSCDNHTFHLYII